MSPESKQIISIDFKIDCLQQAAFQKKEGLGLNGITYNDKAKTHTTNKITVFSIFEELSYYSSLFLCFYCFILFGFMRLFRQFPLVLHSIASK